jgi:hypothetical protein
LTHSPIYFPSVRTFKSILLDMDVTPSPLVLVPMIPGVNRPIYPIGVDVYLGPAFISLALCTLATGIVAAQAIWYCSTFWKGDKLFERITVSAIIVLTFIATFTDIFTCYDTFVTHFGDPLVIASSLSKAFIANAFACVSLYFVSQSFFAARMWRFAQRPVWLGIVLSLAVLADFGCGMSVVGMEVRLLYDQHSLVEQVNKVRKLFIGLWILTASVDIFISSFLVYKLAASRRGTFANTEALITKLITYSLATASLSSLLAIAAAVLSAINNSGLFIVVGKILSQMYPISVLFTLNARSMFKGSSNQTPTLGCSMAAISSSATRRTAGLGSRGVEDGVHVMLEQIRHVDHDSTRSREEREDTREDTREEKQSLSQV